MAEMNDADRLLAERRKALAAQAARHYEWEGDVEASLPEKARPGGSESDWNQHPADLEATGAQYDALFGGGA